MAKSNKPVIWGLFAAGGTVAAFVTPVLIVLTLLAALGHVPDILTYARLHAFVAHSWVKVALFAAISLTLWGAAHRLRITFYDFGVRADATVAVLVYAIAGAGNIAVLVYLLRV
jgi:fumarate reductase subunit D